MLLKSNSLKAAAVLAVGAMLAPLAVGQGNGAQDVATTGGKSQIALQSGASRGTTEGANVIYSNGPYVNAPAGGFGGLDASVLQSTSRAHNIIGYGGAGASSTPTAGFRLADDFTVPAGQMWYVNTLKVYAYRTGGVGVVFDDGVVRVWNGAPNAGGTVIFGDETTNRAIGSTFDSVYRVTETTVAANNREVIEVELRVGKLFTPGTYWIEWGVNTLVAGAAFLPPITITGQDVTGDALQLAVATGVWTPLLMNTTAGANTAAQGMPFTLCGRIACCWEPLIGSNLGHGDDSVTQNLNLGFNFPLPGALPGGATTNTVAVTSNGYVSLNNAAGSDFSPTVAEFLSGAPRIAVPWDDYDASSAGSVWFYGTPFGAVVTWLRIDTFSGATTQSMLQLQMFPNGAFTINTWHHEPVTLRTPVFGVSQGLGAPSIAIDYSAGHVGVPGTATIYESFASGTSDLSGKLFLFEPVNDGVSASYNVSVSPACCTFASSAAIGSGCFGMQTVVQSELIAGGTGITSTTLPPGTVGQVTILGFLPSPFLFDLSGLGAPTCFVHHSNDLFSVPMTGAGLTFMPLPCLGSLMGFSLGVQGVAIVPGINALGVVTGTGYSMTIGNN